MTKHKKGKDVKDTKVVDLFAGCGGLSLGFQLAGFEIVGALDNWMPAIQVYKDNFPKHPFFDVDLSNVREASKIISKLRPTIIVGGPPCQDFSHAGRRDETRGRADLTVAFAEIVSNVKPEWFVMENVDQIAKSKALPRARAIFKKAGYGLTEKLLDASFHKVPQKRKRFFVVGKKGESDGFLEYYLVKNTSKKPMSMREYFGKNLNVEHYYRHPRNYNRRGVFSVDEPSPTIRGVNRPIPSGYKTHPNDSSKDLKNIRPLTTIERSWVQTFPKGFLFRGSKTDIEQLVGNAVPVNLARYVAECLREYINPNEGFFDFPAKEPFLIKSGLFKED